MSRMSQDALGECQENVKMIAINIINSSKWVTNEY
jgi:hypothetical protein